MLSESRGFLIVLAGSVVSYVFGWFGHQRWQTFQIKRKLDVAEKAWAEKQARRRKC